VAAVDLAYLYRILGDETGAQRLLQRVVKRAKDVPIVEREIDPQWLLLEATFLLGDQPGAEQLLRTGVQSSWIRWWHYTASRPTVSALRKSRAYSDAAESIEAHRNREWTRFERMTEEGYFETS
jgi:hypothetical protein